MSAEAVSVVERLQDALGMDDVVAAIGDDQREARVQRAFMELAVPDFEVVMVGPAYQGTRLEFSGADGFREAWIDWTSPFEGYRIDLEEIIDAGDRVVSLVTMVGKTRTGGVEVNAPGAAVWTVVDERLRRVEFHLDRQAALRAAGLDPQSSQT
ncbi:MAG: nuclear transport factor 2 family protein [Actinomycetota bacterium]